MNRISKQKLTTGASFFLDELFSEQVSSGIFDLPENSKEMRKNKQSPRVYRFNPQAQQSRSRAPTDHQIQTEIRGRSSHNFQTKPSGSQVSNQISSNTSDDSLSGINFLFTNYSSH